MTLETTKTAQDIDQLNHVRQATACDRGYIVVGFDDPQAIGEVIKQMEQSNYRVFDIDDDWLVEGKEVHCLHFCHESETEHWIEACTY